MSVNSNSIVELMDLGQNLSKTTFELAKLKFIEKTSAVVSVIVWRLIVVTSLAIFALIFNLGLSIYLGEVLGKLYYGFFCVAGFYLLMGLVFHFFLGHKIKGPVSNFIIMQFLD